jgi:hypothetical protein
MNGEGFARKLSWPNGATAHALTWRKLVKPQTKHSYLISLLTKILGNTQTER